MRSKPPLVLRMLNRLHRFSPMLATYADKIVHSVSLFFARLGSNARIIRLYVRLLSAGLWILADRATIEAHVEQAIKTRDKLKKLNEEIYRHFHSMYDWRGEIGFCPECNDKVT